MQRARGGRVSALRRTLGLCALAALVAVPAAGTRIYQTHVDYSTGQLSIPAAVAIADLNADNKPDLVTANQYGSASVLLGNGDGTFGTHHEYAASGHSESNVVVADLNGDNKPDLVLSNPVVASGQSSVSVLLGAGDGTFPTHTDYATPPFATDVAVGDLNEDGKPDIVTVNNEGNDISVFLGNGDGTFQAAANHGTGSSPWSLGIADFNGDGHLDVFVVGSPDSTVLFGAGDGTFSSTSDLQFEGGDWMTVADLNGDGSPDVASVSSNTARVLLNNTHGSFSFTQLATLPFLAYTVTAADLNGDGHQDLLMADNGSSSIWVLYGNGDGSFQSPFSLTAGSNPLGIAVAPLNGDALPDIAVSNTGSLNVSVILEQLSSDDNLSGLTTSAGTLSPSFDSATTSYSETVSTGTSSITVTPTAEDPSASLQVRVNGGSYAGVSSGQASGALSLDVGDNTVDVNAAAEDGSTKTYTITVTRQAPSSDANLSSLVPSAGTLSPSFDAGTTSYTDQVSNATSSMTVTPTVEDSTATVKVLVNGSYVAVTSGHASPSISVPVGESEIDVKVTAQDTSTQIYEIDVTRLAPYECADTPSPPCWTTFTVDDGPPPAGLQLQTFAQNGSIAVQLQKNGSFELSNDGLDVHAVVDLGSYDPVVFEATGILDAYSETTGATNAIDFRLRPHDSSWSTSCSVGDCGTDEAPLTATHDYTAVFAGLVNDLGDTTGAVKDAMRGMYAYSDAQTFTFPAYDPAAGVVSLTLAAPHFKTNGSTVNFGGFVAFLPNALAEAMGVSDPSALTDGTMRLSSSEGDTGGPAIFYDDTQSGVVVETQGQFPYSSPTFSVATVPDHLVVTAAGSATAGTAFPVTVTAVDDLGDTVRSYTGTVSFSGGGTGATLPADYTFTAGDEGTHTFSGVKLTKAGSRTVTATDTDALTGTTDAIDVSPGAPAELLDISPSTSLPFGATRDITVQVYDAYDNLATNDDSTVVSFAGSGAGAVTGLHAKTVSGGVATETVTGSAGGQVFVHETAAGLLDDGVFFDVLAKNGSGTMTASPTKVKHGTSTLITLTYTAAAGGMVNGTLTVAVPAGWTAPSSIANHAGYPIASVGKVSVSGRVITISNVTRSAGQKLTILFDRKGTVVAPATAVGAQTWAVTQRSQDSGTAKPLASPPKIAVG